MPSTQKRLRSSKTNGAIVVASALTLFAATSVVSTVVRATSIDWSGNYRFEMTDIEKTSLGDPKGRKSYMLHSLQLSPKIIAADGVQIVGKFDVLGSTMYPDSQVGQILGQGPTRRDASQTSTGDDSAVASDRAGSSQLRVQQLYLMVNQEYGAFVAGRAPLEFGLGMTHNAGRGAFDHWYSTRDMVGYKFVIGNFFMMPMLAKVTDYSPAAGKSAQDMIWHLEYDNPESNSAIGLMHQTRTSSEIGNDAPYAAYGAANANDRWNTQLVSLFLKRGFEAVDFKIEASFETGPTGMFKSTGEEIKLNGYGIALEVGFPQKESRWHWALKTGIASGDNPDTTNYEGFHFHKNYDVAMLMFNHPLGRYDFLGNNVNRGPDRLNNTSSPYAREESLDDEAISNAVYVSPSFNFSINDKWTWTNRLTWAQMQTSAIAGASMAKDLGYEYDLGFTFKPYDRLTWVNELGLLMPGGAWAGSESQNFEKGFTYGFTSKVAITF